MARAFLFKVQGRLVNHTHPHYLHSCPALSVGYSGNDMLDSDVISLLCVWAFLKTHDFVSYSLAESDSSQD